MRSASVAEWIVGRFTSKKRATSVVGDLVELQPQKGLLWFWASMAGVVVSLSWRSILGLVAANYVRGWAFGGFGLAFFEPQHHFIDLSHPSGIVLGLLVISNPFLWMTLIYAAIRYGFPDHLTKIAFVSTAFVTATLFCWWHPAIVFLVATIGMGTTSAFVLKPEYRKAAIVLLVTVITGIVSFAVGMTLPLQFVHIADFVFSGPVGKMEAHNFISVRVTLYCIFFECTWISVAACSRMHDWLLRNKPLDEETEEGLA